MAAKIAHSAPLRAELNRLAPAIISDAIPALATELLELLNRKGPVYSVPERHPSEWGEIWAAYLEALRDMPLEAVKIAFRRWDKAELYPDQPGRHSFYPKPAELFKLASDYLGEVRIAAYRAKMALEEFNKTAAPKTELDREEERRKLVERGDAYYDEDGKFRFKRIDLDLKKIGEQRPGETPQQMAQRLREHANKPADPPEEEAF